MMQFAHPAKGQATAPLGQRPAQQPVVRRGVRAMAGAEGERPASPAPEAAASPEQAKPGAQEPKKQGLPRVPSIPVAARANDGVGEQRRRRCLPPALYRPHLPLHHLLLLDGLTMRPGRCRVPGDSGPAQPAQAAGLTVSDQGAQRACTSPHPVFISSPAQPCCQRCPACCRFVSTNNAGAGFGARGS